MATALRIKDHWAEQRLFLRRIIVSALIVAGLSGIVVVRLAQLQITEYDYFSAQSQGNRIRVQPLPPTRGLIFDRHGEVLAENLPSYQLELTPEQTPDIDDIAGKAGHARADRSRGYPRVPGADRFAPAVRRDRDSPAD